VVRIVHHRLSAPAQASGGARRPYRLKRRPEERVRVLGAAMDLVKPAEVFHFVSEQLKANGKAVVANHNLHSLYLMRTEPELRAFFDAADLIEVDSIPLIFWARLIGRHSRRFHRCTYLDWREAFWSAATANGWRVFFVGGAEGVGEKAIEKLSADWPGVQISSHHGYFDIDPDSAENRAVVETINAFGPDVLLVGMGMPRQELWIRRNYDRLAPCVMFTVGGAFDYEAGVQSAAPRWMGQVGLEWLFRLLINPRQMFRRYCVEPWRLLGPALADLRRALGRRGIARHPLGDERANAARGQKAADRVSRNVRGLWGVSSVSRPAANGSP
jgi:N-acetylglucosaminyldiphosphoundecaprenol N-acetyl-beta-D-mannosaminyltransferase